jgi:hypothetical protein
MVGAESYQGQAAHEVMEYAKDQINKRKCIEALVLHAKIERMSRLVGRVAIAVFVVSVVASVASVFSKCIGCGHGQY